MKNNESMNVVVAIDNKYAIQCGITLLSMLENTKTPEKVNVFLLTEKRKLSEENKKKLLQVVESRKAKMHFKEIDISKHLKVKITSYHSPAMCYRLLAPSMLRELDRFLYLDSDILVLGDISEIYFTDLSDKYIGAIKDQGEKIAPKIKEHYKRIVGKGTYFNSGILLVDCKKWRKINADKKAFAFIAEGKAPIFDQDALNHVFNEKVKFLPDKWNFFFRNIVFGVHHFFDKPKNIGIIHFQSPYKPFSSPRITRYEFEYLKYLIKSPWKWIVPQKLLLKLLHPFYCVYLFLKYKV